MMAASAIVTLAVIGFAGPAGDEIGKSPHVMVLYVGADDCAPCQTWHRDYRSRFVASLEFTPLDYREVRSPSLMNVLRDEYWPETLRAYRKNLDHAGVPLWLIVINGKVGFKAAGLSQWESSVLPKITALLR